MEIVEAVEKAAKFVVDKPILNTGEFLGKIKENLRKQGESEEYSEQKVAGFVETRFRRQVNEAEAKS